CAICAAAAMSRCARPSRAAQLASGAGLSDLLGVGDSAQRHAGGDCGTRGLHNRLLAVAEVVLAPVNLCPQPLISGDRDSFQLRRERRLADRTCRHTSSFPKDEVTAKRSHLDHATPHGANGIMD
ncbi:MAG: hypothetical protein ACLP50_10635, partial [Solirubrobacteraceae bacterium]